MSAILFLLHVVERIMARGRAIVLTPTAVSNKVISLQAAMSPSILVPVMVVIRLLQMERRVVLRESRPRGSIHEQSVPNPSVRTRKRILCDGCCKWHHIKCVNMDHCRLYTEYGSSDETWYCTKPVVSEDAPVTDPFESNPTDNITSGRQSLSPKILVLNARSIRN